MQLVEEERITEGPIPSRYTDFQLLTIFKSNFSGLLSIQKSKVTRVDKLEIMKSIAF